METWRLLWEGAQPAGWNMAVDEAIWSCYPRLNRPTLRLYRWARPTLSLGTFQPVSDLDLEACAARGMAWVRRPTGGRAVLHDHELTYSVVAGLSLFPPGVAGSYRRLSRALVAALEALGLEARLERVHRRPASAACFEAPGLAELTVRGRKVVGSAQTRSRHALLQHGSLPLTFPHEALAAALRLSPAQARALRRQAAGLNDFADPPLTVEQVAEALVRGFERCFSVRLVPGELDPAERARAQRLMETKYAQPGWNERREVLDAVGR